MLNAGGTPSIQTGTLAARPVAGTAGRLYVDTTNNVLQRDTGAAWVNVPNLSGYVRILDRSATPLSLTGTTENDLVNYTIPAGTLGTTGMIRISLAGILNNASGATRNYTIRVRYGATILYADTSSNQAANSITGFYMTFYFAANAATNAQTINGIIHIGTAGGATTGTTGDLSTDETTAMTVISGTSAIDSTVDQTFRITIQASGTTTTTTRYAYAIESL